MRIVRDHLGRSELVGELQSETLIGAMSADQRVINAKIRAQLTITARAMDQLLDIIAPLFDEGKITKSFMKKILTLKQNAQRWADGVANLFISSHLPISAEATDRQAHKWRSLMVKWAAYTKRGLATRKAGRSFTEVPPPVHIAFKKKK